MGWEEGGVGVSSLSELKSFPSNAGVRIILRGLFFLVFGVLSDGWYRHASRRFRRINGMSYQKYQS